MSRRPSSHLRTARALPSARSGMPSPGANWSARSKVAVVLEMLRGVDVNVLCERYNLGRGDLLSWRDLFLAGGEANLSGFIDPAGVEPSGSLKRLVAALEPDGPFVPHRHALTKRGLLERSRRAQPR